MMDALEYPGLVFLGLFVALMVCLEIGSRLGRRGIADPGNAGSGHTSAIDGAVFALLGLLMAFTFSGAAARFDVRRELIVSEANAIGTAYLRIDVAPAESQPALREAFKRYSAARIDVYKDVRDAAKVRARLLRANDIQKEIWELAVAAGRRPDAQPATNIVLLPALNEMIDITTTRVMATQMHPPIVIYWMLVGLSLTGAVLAGHGLAGLARRDWLHMLSFAFIMSLALYVILDMEFPRIGYITVDEFERMVIDITGTE